MEGNNNNNYEENGISDVIILKIPWNQPLRRIYNIDNEHSNKEQTILLITQCFLNVGIRFTIDYKKTQKKTVSRSTQSR